MKVSLTKFGKTVPIFETKWAQVWDHNFGPVHFKDTVWHQFVKEEIGIILITV